MKKTTIISFLKTHTMSGRMMMILLTILPILGMEAKQKDISVQQQPMTLWYNQPATFFEESLPIGNGKLGALVYGNPDDDLLFLNDITLWTGKPVDYNEGGDAYRWIPEIRKALFNEDYALADSLQLHVQGHNSQFYQPLATLHIKNTDAGNGSSMTNYRRELSLDSSLVKISYERNHVKYHREYFASNPDKMIAVNLRASKVKSINCELLLTSQVPHSVKASQQQLTLMGHAVGDPKESIHFCSNLIVKNKDGHVTVSDSTLLLKDVTEVTIYFVNETSFNGFDKHPVKEGASYIEQVADDAWHLVNYTYEQLRERHIADYQQYFKRLKLQLGTVSSNASLAIPTDQLLKSYNDDYTNAKTSGAANYLEALYFQYGRYLLISSSRTSGVPANLQGLWTPHLWSPWRGNYTMNINLEENYWPAHVTNLAEMAKPLEAYAKGLATTGRHTAQHYYGINKGWCSSHNSDIWCMSNPVGEKNEKPEWANWNLGGAWLMSNLWEHYLFTQDKDYLRNVAFPLMKGAADFCLQWLVENPKKSGELITAPSTSPENEYVTDKGYHGMTCYGGTADLAIIRELLANVTTATGICGEHSDDYRQALQRLHPYTIGHMGDLNEWYYDWDDYDFKHRHQSHLIGLYPGHHISITETPELAQAAVRSLEIKGDETTGWSTGWRINLWARLHNATQAYHIYQKLLTYVSPDGYQGPDKRRSGGTYPNLFDAHPPFQIDGNFGGTAGVCEMLVQSSSTNTIVIELLPALPETWKNGSVKGLCTRGGYELDMIWANGKVTNAILHHKSGKTEKICIIVNGQKKYAKIKPGKTKKII